MRIAFAIVAVLAFAAVAMAVQCATSIQEPDVPTYTIGLAGTNLQLTITFERNATAGRGYDESFRVIFNSSETTPCDFDAPDGDATTSYGSYWTRQSVTDCANTWQFTAPINTVLGQCGYRQDNAREAGRTHFLNTIKMLTVQTREDLRSPYNATREFPFTSDISIATNTTATVSGLQVFGTAVTLQLLGDLKVSVVDNFAINPALPYLYYVTGTFVTSVQFPYRLENINVEEDGNFNLSASTITANDYCDTHTNSNNDSCTQEWDFSYQIDSAVACVNSTSGVAQLTDQWVKMTFKVNCSADFAGECAPDFAVDPTVNLTLTSANFCPKSSQISLDSDVGIYAYQPSGSNTQTPSAGLWGTETTSAAVGSSTSSFFTQTINTDFQPESIFVYESTLYGEVRVKVNDGAATLATTAITAIRTDPDSIYTTKQVYTSTPVFTADDTVKVYNTGFGSPGQSPQAYSNSRARFEFQLNADTFDRDNNGTVAADPAQGGSIEIDLVVTFAEGAQSIEDDWTSAVLLQEFVMDNNGKSVPIKVSPDAPRLFEEADGTLGATKRINFANSIAAPTITVNASAASNALTIGAVAVAGIAIIALVAVVVLRRPQAAKPSSSNLNMLPHSSSFSTVPAAIPMENTANAYSQV